MMGAATFTVVLAFNACMALMNWRLQDPDWKPGPFERASWLANREPANSRYSDRMLMIDDLMRTRDLRGWTQDEVVTLLGPPDQVGIGGGQLAYHLGLPPGIIAPDPDYLVIRLSSEGKVTAYYIWKG
jgi:hypothetical protein